jgi:AbiJ N-terminal domain 4
MACRAEDHGRQAYCNRPSTLKGNLVVLFSQRIGKTPVRSAIQVEDLDADTRVAIWNGIYGLREMMHRNYGDSDESFGERLWTVFFKQHRDQYGRSDQVWGAMKKLVIEGSWYEVLDLLEFIPGAAADTGFPAVKDQLRFALNGLFENYLVGYRFIGGEITPIDSASDIVAIQQALTDSNGLAGVKHHLGNALSKLSSRTSPDYANSVEESLSAVESLGERLTGKDTLGSAMDALAGIGITVHPAQLKAWKAMYGWGSDAGGIRHSSQTIPNVDQATAKYTLITSSAFVSYLIETARKAGVKL